MKIKKTSFFVSIILFVLLLPSMIFILSNLAFWPWNNYIFSNNMNKFLEKIFPKNEKIQLKKWDYYYRLSEYEKALQTYVKINCTTDEVCFLVSYNLGNTYYRLWEKIIETNQKIWFWQKSLSSYQKALQIQEDENTRKNYEFVLKKLNDFMSELNQEKQNQQQQSSENNQDNSQSEEKESTQQDQQQQNQQQDESSQESSQDGENSQENQTQNQQNQTQPRWPSIKIDENALDETKELSPQEKEAVEAYLKELQEEEKNNIHLNKPREQRDIFDILTDDFSFDNLDKNQNWW